MTLRIIKDKYGRYLVQEKGWFCWKTIDSFYKKIDAEEKARYMVEQLRKSLQRPINFTDCDDRPEDCD